MASELTVGTVNAAGGKVTVGDSSANELLVGFESSSQDYSIGANGNFFMVCANATDLDANQLLTISSAGEATFTGAVNSNFFTLADASVVRWGAGTATYIQGSQSAEYINFIVNSSNKGGFSSTGLAVTGQVTATGDLGVGTTNPAAGTNAPTAKTSAGRLNTYTGTTAEIANSGTLDIPLTMPKGLMAYIIESNWNTGHMSAGFFRSNSNGAISAYTFFGQSENGVAVTQPSVGNIRITNNTGGAATFFYAITVIAG